MCPSGLAAPMALGTLPLLSPSALAGAPRHFPALQLVPLQPLGVRSDRLGDGCRGFFSFTLVSADSMHPALLWPQRAGAAPCLLMPQPRVEWGKAGRNPHPAALRGKNPVGFKGARVSLAVFQAALCQRFTWELCQNNVRVSCRDPGDWNVSLGKPPRHCYSTRHGTVVPVMWSTAEPATLSCL